MEKHSAEHPQLPSEDQLQSLLELARDPRLQTSVAALIELPEEWDRAMQDPSSWLSAQGLDLPAGLSAVITKDISISKPLDPYIPGMPGPDWIPFSIRFTNCRTYWVPTRDRDGKITGLREETVCFGIEIVHNRQPGPLG